MQGKGVFLASPFDRPSVFARSHLVKVCFFIVLHPLVAAHLMVLLLPLFLLVAKTKSLPFIYPLCRHKCLMRLRQPDHIDNDGFALVNQYEIRRTWGGIVLLMEQNSTLNPPNETISAPSFGRGNIFIF